MLPRERQDIGIENNCICSLPVGENTIAVSLSKLDLGLSCYFILLIESPQAGGGTKPAGYEAIDLKA